MSANDQVIRKYEWTKEAKAEYLKSASDLLNLFTPDDAESVATKKPDYNIDGKDDLSYEIINNNFLCGTLPKSNIQAELLKGEKKLNIRFIESDDKELEEIIVNNFTDAKILSVFIAFNRDELVFFTITYQANCVIIHIKDQSADQILFELLNDESKYFIFPKFYYCSGKKCLFKSNKFEQMKSRIENYFNYLGQIKELKIHDIDTYSMFKEVCPHDLAFYTYMRDIVCKEVSASHILWWPRNLDDTCVDFCFKIMAYKTYFYSLLIDKLEKLEKLQNPEFIPYQKLVDAQMLFEGFWPLNKTIKVEFARSQIYDVKLMKSDQEWVDFDWCDPDKYYCVNSYQSKNSNFFVIGDYSTKRILIIQDNINKFDKQVQKYFNDKDYKFVFHYCKILPVIKSLGVTEGYVIDRKISDELKDPGLNPEFYSMWECVNDSFTHILNMAKDVYEMTNVFSKQKETQSIGKVPLRFLK